MSLRRWRFQFLKFLVEEKNTYKDFCLPLLILIIGPRHNFCTDFLLCHWSIFSSVHISLDARKSA
jgi:hypothetical protein